MAWPINPSVEKTSTYSDLVTAAKETVAVRMPNHPMSIALLEKLDFPIAAPSANPFGSISPTSAEHVYHYFKDNLDLILDGGHCEKA